LEQITVLYGKSGTGKSSLVNAGIIPRAEQDGKYEPLRVRFNAWVEGSEGLSPLRTLQESIRKGEKRVDTFLDELIPDEDSLWHDVKEYQLQRDQEAGLLLLLDQFEELFTYPPEQVLEFRKHLAEALYTAVPQRYWDRLEQQVSPEGDLPLTAQEIADFQFPPSVKVAVTIRSDRMHLLQQLDDYLPSILKNCIELGALDALAATEAICEPARLPGDFECPPFDYTDEAVQKILHFLTDDGTDKIENTQLQIVCHSIEQRMTDGMKAQRPNKGIRLIQAQELGDLSQIIRQYYDDKIARISEVDQRQAAQKLIEEGLIFEEEERRLSLYEGQILRTYNLTPDTLRLLVDSHLLRAEPSLQGGYTYELSHDTLVAPVLAAKARRRQEEQAEAEHAEMERQRIQLFKERRRRQRANLLAAVMVVLATCSLVALVYANHERRNTEHAKVQIEQEKVRAEEAERLAKAQLQHRITLEARQMLEKARSYHQAEYLRDAKAVLDSIQRMKPDKEVVQEAERLRKEWSLH
ncbi:MAG TPA: hypothetical protein PK671_17645, partial [Candidatus Obscuribacter sp.]|nr:hypothetical protein [Candidatus Obscuribacter sp.]